jgi:hypothetical protein
VLKRHSKVLNVLYTLTSIPSHCGIVRISGSDYNQSGNETGNEYFSDPRIHDRYHMGSPSLRLEASTEDVHISDAVAETTEYSPASREGHFPIRRRLYLQGYHSAKPTHVCARTKKEGMSQAAWGRYHMGSLSLRRVQKTSAFPLPLQKQLNISQ